MNEEEPIKAEIILYQDGISNVPVEVRYLNETFWLTQKEMGELFNCSSDNVSLHLSNIYKEEELQESATTEEFSVVRQEGSRKVTRTLRFYNLDAIIAVGYRVNSKQATRFRQWATATLKEYIVKGFVLNDDMLKNGAPFGKDYFDELLVRIRDIRASERRAYQKITDIFQECSFDFLEFNRRSVLKHKGARSKKQADAKAREEFRKFQVIQDRTYENDFEKEIKRIKGN